MIAYRIMFAAVLTTASLGVPCTHLQAETHRTLTGSFPVTTGQRIDIRGFTGSQLTMTSWEKDEVSISVKVSITASDQNYEQAFVDGVSLRSSTSSDLLMITFDDGSGSESTSRSFWESLKSLFGGTRYIKRGIEGEIRVPRTHALSANVPYATVSLEGIEGELSFRGSSNTLSLAGCRKVEEVSNDYGNTTVRNCGGPMRLKGQSATIAIEDFSGAIACDAPYSTITVVRTSGNLRIGSASGNVHVSTVTGDVDIVADYSDLDIDNITGMVNVRDQSGKVDVTHAGGAAINASYSRIRVAGIAAGAKELVVDSQSGTLLLEDIAANVRIDNPYSTMTLQNIRGGVALSTRSGTVRATDVTGDWDVSAEYSTITADRLAGGRFHIANKSNPVRLSLTSVPSSLQIRNEYGSVSVAMPRGFAGDVSLDAEYGSIDTNLPIRSRNRGGSAYALGKVGSGSGTISIEVTSGNIVLEEK